MKKILSALIMGAVLMTVGLTSCGGPDNGKAEKIIERMSYGKHINKDDVKFATEYAISYYEFAEKKLNDVKDAQGYLDAKREIKEKYPYFSKMNGIFDANKIDEELLKKYATAKNAYNTAEDNVKTKYGEEITKLQQKNSEIITNIFKDSNGSSSVDVSGTVTQEVTEEYGAPSVPSVPSTPSVSEVPSVEDDMDF